MTRKTDTHWILSGRRNRIHQVLSEAYGAASRERSAGGFLSGVWSKVARLEKEDTMGLFKKKEKKQEIPQSTVTYGEEMWAGGVLRVEKFHKR